ARQPAECIHERRLDGVLRLLTRTELVQAVAEDLCRVALVQVSGRVGSASDRSLDAGCTTYGRDCGQPCPPTAIRAVCGAARTANVAKARGVLQPSIEGR